jgi:succinate dehydrogenase / fumarate reductase, membrane anchor subunit
MPYPDPTEFKTPLARARNVGSAKDGTHHWWLVKVTAVALVPLTLWFLWSFLTKVAALGGGYDVALAWVKKPYNAFPLALVLFVSFYHAALGGQEIIIDYVHNRRYQIPTLILYKFFCYGFAVLSVFSVLYITFRM